MLKVMVACGCGMGTSQIMKTRAQQVLKELGIQATIHHTSLDEAQSIANDFDLIIIMLGTNDVLNNIDFSNQKTADVLKIYVEECRAKFGKDKPKILLVSPILINDNCLTHPIFKDLYSEKSIEKSIRSLSVRAAGRSRGADTAGFTGMGKDLWACLASGGRLSGRTGETAECLRRKTGRHGFPPYAAAAFSESSEGPFLPLCLHTGLH